MDSAWDHSGSLQSRSIPWSIQDRKPWASGRLTVRAVDGPSARWAPGRSASLSGDLADPGEEGPLAVGVDLPFNRRRLVAIAVVACAWVEVAPGGVLRERRVEV